MIGRRSYSGGSIDGGYQHISEAPAYQDDTDDVVYATDPEDVGEETAENVPVPETNPEPERSDVDGQSTLEDWGWSA